MKLKRLVSAVLAVGMALTILPTAAFASATLPPHVTGLEINSEGKVVMPEGYADRTYVHTVDGTQQWAAANNGGYLAIRRNFSFAGSETTMINATVSTAGVLSGGIYGTGVSVTSTGTIVDGFFKGKITENKGTISGGIFSNDVNIAGERILTATGCNIYSEKSIAVSENAYISNVAYIVGEQNQKMILTLYAPTLEGWEVNGVKLDKSNPTNTVLNDVSMSCDEEGNQKLTFTVPQENVTIAPIVKQIALKIGASGLPEYDGRTYMGNLDLDGWHLTKNSSGSYPYTLTMNQGTAIDLENNNVDWAFSNFGTLKNGITPGNVVNRQNADGTYGRVENIVHRMNVNFGDQNPKTTWVTLKNATACDNVFNEIFGVIGTQTVTVKAEVTPFLGWEYSGSVSEDVAKQIDAQKNNETMTLTLNGDDTNTIALTAKTTGDTFAMTLVDGKASVDDKEVSAAQYGQTVTLTAADAPDGMVFDRWEITPTDIALNLEGFDANAATTSFVMPAQTLTIRAMYRMADVEEPNVLGTAAVIGTVAVGGAVVAWQGYNIAADIYARDILPEGTAIPETKEALAVMLWQNAGKPEVVAADGTALTETEQAQQWVVANGLMENEADGTFHPEKGVGKFAALNAVKEQSEAKVNE